MPSRLRSTFNADAILCDEVRPGYPDELFSDIAGLAHLTESARALEIGCGTGQATRSLAARGWKVDCVEVGAHLAAVARRNLERFPAVQVEVSPFEAWRGVPGTYDLAFSATAFHWIDPDIGFPKLAELIKPEGAVALVWTRHVQGPDDNGVFAALTPIYERDVPRGAIWNLPTVNDTQPDAGTTQRLSQIAPVTIRTYGWSERYGTERFLKLLNTYADHRSLEADVRQRLYRGIASVIDQQYRGSVTMSYLTLLYLAVR